MSSSSPAGCSASGCGFSVPFPLLVVPRRGGGGGFLRLCPSCVLHHNPGSFCFLCLRVLSSSPVHRCSRCPAVAHASCRPGSTGVLLCPPCAGQKPYFAFQEDAATGRRCFDEEAGKVLVLASQIAVTAMKKAAETGRVEAENKWKRWRVVDRRAKNLLAKMIRRSNKRKKVCDDRNPIARVLPGQLVEENYDDEEDAYGEVDDYLNYEEAEAEVEAEEVTITPLTTNANAINIKKETH